MAGLDDLLNPNNVLGKRKPRKPRPPARTNPRPSRPSQGDGLRGVLNPNSVLGRNPSISPRGESKNTDSFSPRTGQRGQRHRLLSSPIDGASISSPFGSRIHPVSGRHSNHTGIDFAAGMGTPIYAPRSGRVNSAVSGDSIYGNQIILGHGPKLQTMYGHLSKLLVDEGQKVKRGDVIGYVGSTGLSTGPHLHWETWKNGQPVNPSGLYSADEPRTPSPKRRRNRSKIDTMPDISSSMDSDLAELLGFAPDNDRRRNNAPLPVGPRGQAASVRLPVVAQGSHMPGNDSSSDDLRLRNFLQSIATQESGGNYGAIGVPTQYGTAYGKYQILDSNIEGPGGWDQEVLGQNISVDQFLNTPSIQEAIARGKLTDYFRQYGPLGAAKAWYAGPGNAFTNSDSPQYGGPSINDYAMEVVNRMRGYR